MRAGAEPLMNCVSQTAGAAHAHYGLPAHQRARHAHQAAGRDGLACGPARRLNAEQFKWPRERASAPLSLTRNQFDALDAGLPWQRHSEMSVIAWM